VGQESERAKALGVIRDYHAAELADLVSRVGDAVDRFRAGTGDAFEVDEVIFQYNRSAKELWKFCNLGDPYDIAAVIRTGGHRDWWATGARKHRRDS
jgi:hypothetical protein